MDYLTSKRAIQKFKKVAQLPNKTQKQKAKILGISYTQYRSLFESKEDKDKRKALQKEYRAKKKKEPYYHLINKINFFKKRAKYNTDFSYIDVINKFGTNPICYLTGLPIDYNDPSTYHLDHFIPVNNGGSSDLENLRLANPMANEMKRDYDIKDFIEMCGIISEYCKDKF